MPVFDRGDVVVVPVDPVSGHEQRGTRPALVLTPKSFSRLGDVPVAPITQGGDFSRHAGFAIDLAQAGCRTRGAALVNKTRMLDLAARKVERVPAAVIDDAIARLDAILTGCSIPGPPDGRRRSGSQDKGGAPGAPPISVRRRDVRCRSPHHRRG